MTASSAMLENPSCKIHDTLPNVKVFFLVDSFRIGGTERQTLAAAVELQARGVEVTVGCLRAEGALRQQLLDAGITTVEFNPRGSLLRPAGMKQVLRLAAYLRGERFEVFHAHDLWSNLMGVPAARLARVQVIISSQRDLGHLNWYARKLNRKIIRLLQRQCTWVVANSNTVAESLRPAVPVGKIQVVYNGVDYERFAGCREQASDIAGFAADRTTLVSVGNLNNAIKGQQFLLQAFAGLLRQYPQLGLVLVGGGTQRRPLEEHANELGISGNVLFAGQRLDVPEVLSCCDIFVLPSLAEGMPNAVLEAMAAGLPIVATAVGGTVEVVEDGTTGLLVPAGNSEALRMAVGRLLADPALASRLASAGQRYVNEHHGYDRVVEQLASLYVTSRNEAGPAEIPTRSHPAREDRWAEELAHESTELQDLGLRYVKDHRARHSQLLEYEATHGPKIRVLMKRITAGSGDWKHKLHRESAALWHLQAQLPVAVADTIPRVLAFDEGRNVLVMRALPGQPLARLLKRYANAMRLANRPQFLAELGSRVGIWLRDFHYATAQASVAHDHVRFVKDFDAEWRQCAHLGSDSVLQDMRSRALALSTALQGVSIAAAARHGDFIPQNILVTPDAISVVDFENSLPLAPICEDVGTFMAYLLMIAARPIYSAVALDRFLSGFSAGYGEIGNRDALNLFILRGAVTIAAQFRVTLRGILSGASIARLRVQLARIMSRIDQSG